MSDGGKRMHKISLILGSNHELWWEGLTYLLAGSEDLELAGVCYDRSVIVSRTRELKPEVVLLDEEITNGDSGSLVSSIIAEQPTIKVMIVIPPYKHTPLSGSLKAGAKGFIDKNITFRDLANSIRQVVKGGLVIVSPQVVHEFIEQVNPHDQQEGCSRVDIASRLSRREREILTLLSIRSITNREIAQKLFITESTVKAHLSSILEKMNVRNREEAAMLAREKIHTGSPNNAGISQAFTGLKSQYS
jgi:DNA-binding NarL/FixJ family response regulator